jgi:hypothetical protein
MMRSEPVPTGLMAPAQARQSGSRRSHLSETGLTEPARTALPSVFSQSLRKVSIEISGALGANLDLRMP